MAAASRDYRHLPKLLRATYLADQENLLKETRGTALFYLPGPVFWLIVLGILDYSVAAIRVGLPGFPVLSNLWTQSPVVDRMGPQTYLLVAFLFLTLIVFIWFIVRYLRWISTVYAVTNQRVIVQSGIVGRSFDEIPVLQVHGVDVHQTGWQRLLGYGSVRVSSEGGSPIGNEDWLGIPRPFEFQRLIENANQTLLQARNAATV